MLKRRAVQWAFIWVGVFLLFFFVKNRDEKWLEGTWVSEESTIWITESSITSAVGDKVVSGSYEVIERHVNSVLLRVNIVDMEDRLVQFIRIGSDSLKSGDEYWEREN